MLLTDTFECVWCKDAEEISASLKSTSDPAEYTFSTDRLGGYDNKTGKPICDTCADAAQEEMMSTAKYEQPPAPKEGE
jgi:hypothetical protein